MSRSPFQVLVFLLRQQEGQKEVLLLKRADMGIWQGIAGGGEGEESPVEAAKREVREETGACLSCVTDLDSVEMLSVLDVVGSYRRGEGIAYIPEYVFFASVSSDTQIRISKEHTEYRWCGFDQALDLLEWNSNKQAVKKIRAIRKR